MFLRMKPQLALKLCLLGSLWMGTAGAITSPRIDPASYVVGPDPSAILMTFANGPDTRGFAWQTDDTVTGGELRVVAGTCAADAFEQPGVRSVQATSVNKSEDPIKIICHKAQMTGLSAGTYSYRLGAPNHYAYGTFAVRAAESTAPVTIVTLSDAQPRSADKVVVWENTVSNAAAKVAALGLTTDLVLTGGDLFDVNWFYSQDAHAKDANYWFQHQTYGAFGTGAGANYKYNYWKWGLDLDVATPYFPGVPWALASGNHDCEGVNSATGAATGDIYYQHVTAVNWASSSLCCHSFNLGNVHVVVLPCLSRGDNASLYTSVKTWVENDLDAAQTAGATDWTVVEMHWGPYTTGDHGKKADPIADLFAPVFSRYHVDLVIQAHDHTCSKTLPYRWNAAGVTSSATDNTVINLNPATTTVGGETYDLNPQGTYYVICGCSGHRVGEDGTTYVGTTGANSYTTRSRKVAVGKITQTTAYAHAGDDASQNPNASMFGVLRVAGGTLAYDFYVVATDGLSAPVLFDTLRVCKVAVPASSVTGFPIPATLLEHPQQDGSAAHPYMLAAEADFTTLAQAVADGTAGSFHYALAADVAFTQPFAGIGTKGGAAFRGFFDGRNHTLRNVTYTSHSYAGLFNSTSGATIENLCVVMSGMQGGGGAAFVGQAENTTLRNLTARGTMGTTAAPLTHNVGGIAVRVIGTSSFEACTNEMSLCASYSKAGGIFVFTDDAGSITLTDCLNKGDIMLYGKDSDHNNLGGLVGWAGNNGVTITGSANTGALTLYTSTGAPQNEARGLGGLVGYQNKGALTVEDCENAGDLLLVERCTLSGQTGLTMSVGGAVGIVNSASASVTLQGFVSGGTLEARDQSASGADENVASFVGRSTSALAVTADAACVRNGNLPDGGANVSFSGLPELPPTGRFLVTPYVQHPATNAMSVLWFTDTPCDATISWWPVEGGSEQNAQHAATTGVWAPALTNNVSNGESTSPLKYRHRHRIEGLTPGTRYAYAVELTGGERYTNTFKTAPDANSSVRFIYYNDSETEPSDSVTTDWTAPDGVSRSSTYFIGQNTGYASNIVMMASREPDFYAIAGDLAAQGGRQLCWDEFWKHNAGGVVGGRKVGHNDPAGSTPILAAIGNHDLQDVMPRPAKAVGMPTNCENYGGGESALERYLSYFEYEPNGVDFTDVDARDRSQMFHRVDYGPVTMIFLDTNNGDDSDFEKDTNTGLFRDPAVAGGYGLPAARSADFNPGSRQYTWLTNQLADAQLHSKFTFVVNHQCPYSVGYHNRKNVQESGEWLSARALRVLGPTLVKYGVDGWLCGHDEMVEHTRITGEEVLPDGTTRSHSVDIFDMGTAGDGLRGGEISNEGINLVKTTRTYEDGTPEIFRAHVDAPEVWQNGVLVSGGKHYGHMEVNVAEVEPGLWTATLEPVYMFVSKNAQGKVQGFERRVYDDVLVLTNDLRAAEGADGFVYDNESGVTDLTLAAAWKGGRIPGPNDVAVFDGATPATLTLGETTVWAGVVRTNAQNQLTLLAPAGGTLSLGAEGLISCSGNGDFNRFYIRADIVLTTDQTWRWWNNKTPCISGSISSDGNATLHLVGRKLGTGDIGNILVYGPVTMPVEAKACRIYSLEGATWSPSPVLSEDASFLLIPGTGPGVYDFTDIITSGTFDNATTFSFGNHDGDGTYKTVQPTVTLSAGDSLTGPGGDTASRSKGVIHVQDSRVIVDGADVTKNIWFYLRSGTWTQKSGDTSFNYAALVGRGSTKNFGLHEQRLLIEGGTFASRRLSVGMGNSDDCPAEFRVTGGSYQSSLPNCDSGNYWAAGLAIAQRTASGEETTVKVDDKNVTVALSDSEYVAGRVEISGGTVKTPAVIFGNHNNAWNMKDTKSGARFALTGGELQLGQGGFMTGAAWGPDGSSHASWYDAVLAGGTVSFYRNNTYSSADVRLSNRCGGTEINVSQGLMGTEFAGSFYGEGGLRKTGAGALKLTGGNDYTGRTDVVEGKIIVGDRPENAVWCADDLFARGEGGSAKDWSNRSGSGTIWSITHGTSIPGTEGTTPPSVIVSDPAFNGHAAVTFNGAQTAFLTGNAVQPISNRDAFTVALVLRTENGFVGIDSSKVENATQFFGTSIAPDSNTREREYGLAINAQGQIGCGMFGAAWKDANANTNCVLSEHLWSTNAVNDGKSHLVIWSWKFSGEHVLQVDGDTYRLASPSNDVKVTRQTRIVFGVGERQNASRRFQGAIAEIRMTDSQITSTQRAALVNELGWKYGVAGFETARPWAETPSPDTPTVPTPAAVWTADTLTQTAGQSVSEWTERDGKGAGDGSVWTFTSALANTILAGMKGYAGSTASPVIAADTANGHKLVSFNGTNACMALTGAKNTPNGNGDGSTIAMVVRFTGYGTGGEAFTAAQATPFFGTSYGADQNKENWGLVLSGAARVGFYHQTGYQDSTTVRSRRRFLDDGEVHVIVATLPKASDTEGLCLTIDGRVVQSTNTTAAVLISTRILLGGSECGSKAHYAPVDVAELRLWKSQVLDAAQVRAVSEELASTYGVYLDGYERGIAVNGQQRSREVFVHEGALYGALKNHDFMLYPGQTIWGDGATSGLMILAPGAAVKATATNSFSVVGGLDLMDGAAVAADIAADAELQPVSVTGNVTLPVGDVKIRLVLDEGAKPAGQLLTWTGSAVSRGTTTFTVEGVSPNAVKVVVDEANKNLRLVAAGGSVIVIR